MRVFFNSVYVLYLCFLIPSYFCLVGYLVYRILRTLKNGKSSF